MNHVTEIINDGEELTFLECPVCGKRYQIHTTVPHDVWTSAEFQSAREAANLHICGVADPLPNDNWEMMETFDSKHDLEMLAGFVLTRLLRMQPEETNIEFKAPGTLPVTLTVSYSYEDGRLDHPHPFIHVSNDNGSALVVFDPDKTFGQ